MKTPYFIIAILAIALCVVTGRLVATGSSNESAPESDAATGASPRSQAAAIYNNIMTRASVRTYSDRPVSPEAVDSLCRAAMAAPTAMNKQPWQIVVIRDRATLDTIASRCPNIKMAAEAQVAFAICGDLSLAIEGDGQPYWIQDCSAATENLLLAAHGMGLGAVWCGIYPIQERVDLISSLLGLPENVVPLNIIPVGYPGAAVTPKEKFDPAKVHTDKY